jgi:hypothetical protein
MDKLFDGDQLRSSGWFFKGLPDRLREEIQSLDAIETTRGALLSTCCGRIRGTYLSVADLVVLACHEIQLFVPFPRTQLGNGLTPHYVHIHNSRY